jgi:hypothetical protein
MNTLNAQSISGKVIGINGEWLPFANVSLNDSGGMKTICFAEADVNGIYKIANVIPGYYLLKIGYVGYGIKSFSIKINKDTIINIDMIHPCEYDKSINDNTCPICHKKDSVISI